MKSLFFVFTLLLAANIFGQDVKTIHVLVALCDNQYQGIVKVPKGIGNGQDPKNNLYWGCGYGVSTYFKKSKEWKEVKRFAVDSVILERVIFKHKTKDYYLVADAYNGKEIKQCTHDFLNAVSGRVSGVVKADTIDVPILGNSEIIAYIGHNGLMDFKLVNNYKNKDGRERKAVILACASKQYFTPYLKNANAYPLLWTTNLMAPEAYTLYDALESYIGGKDYLQVRGSAAAAYSKYQKCSLRAAKGLLVTGY